MSLGDDVSHPEQDNEQLLRYLAAILQTPRLLGGAVATIFARRYGDCGAGTSCKIFFLPNPPECNFSLVVLKRINALSTPLDTLDNFQLIIHRDGNLQQNSGNINNTSRMVTYRLDPDQVWLSGSATTETLLLKIPPTVEIEVGFTGTRGIIGRRISVVDAEGVFDGDGVIGWNQ